MNEFIHQWWPPALLAAVVGGHAYFLSVLRRNRRAREQGLAERAKVAKGLPTLTPLEGSALVAAFQAEPNRGLRVPARSVACFLASVICSVATGRWWIAAMGWAILVAVDRLLGGPLECPRCGYTFRATDGWNLRECRQCGTRLASDS